MAWHDYLPKTVKHMLSRRDPQDLVNAPQSLIGNPKSQGPIEPEKPSQQSQKRKPDTQIHGPTGTPIVSGFVEDLQEYNPDLRGRAALGIYEQMRRSDGTVAAVLLACKLPILGAEYKLIPGVPDNHPNFKLGQQIAKQCQENLFGGLEIENSLGMKSSQRWESVLQNATLCFDYGCSGYEDIWVIDGDMVRLSKLAPRLPLTFYRFHTDPGGETLRAVEQWGYRGQDWVNVSVPADKFTLIVHDMEGANFYGKAILRPAYQPWYRKQALIRIDAIACERNGVGIASMELALNASDPDRDLAVAYVEDIAANESSGIVYPNGYKFAIKGVEGREHVILPSIQACDEEICRSALAMFIPLGTTQSGSRALGSAMIDFFEMSLQAKARLICDAISETTIRRWVDYNYPTASQKIPYPKLQAPHIAVLNPLELFSVIKDLATANVDLLHPDDDVENWMRQKVGMPAKGKPRPRFSPTAVRIQEQSEEPVSELEAEQQPDNPIGTAKPSKGTFSTRQVRMSRQLDGRLKWHGLDISIENAVGSTRKGVDRNGKAWAVAMQHPYGYIRHTEGVDGDHVDCFMGDDPNAEYVYIVHQKQPDTGAYDEDKCMLDFSSAKAAKDAFLVNYTDARFFHSMTVLPVAEFIDKVKATFDKPKKIHASDRLTRALKPHELKHDFDGHAERQDSTQAAIRRILGAAKPALFREVARRASQLEPQYLDSMAMPFDRSLVARITKSASIAHKFGFDQVYAERYRATKRPKTQRAQLSTPAPAQAKKSSEQDRPGLIAEAAVSDLNNWLTARARGAHIDGYKKGLREDDLYGSILDSLEEGSDAPLDRISMEAARSAVTGGRYAAFRELENEIDRYARSEAMDRNTCGPCQDGDGSEWESLDEVDWSPGDDCEGGDACRGQLMPIFADEGTTELG